MLDTAIDSSATNNVKKYAPPNQRGRVINRRKTGDRLERTNSLYGNDGEKIQISSSRNISTHREGGNSNVLSENLRPGLIAIDGCCNGEAAKLLNDRWAAAMHSFNDTSIDLSERPMMYSGSSASAWGNLKLPHQLMPPTLSVGPSGWQMDFLAELRRALRNANASTNT